MSSRRLPKYEIVDRQSRKVVGRASTLNSARRSVDRRDAEYGACRYFHRPAQVQEIRA